MAMAMASAANLAVAIHASRPGGMARQIIGSAALRCNTHDPVREFARRAAA
jgi:hypothetical protein